MRKLRATANNKRRLEAAKETKTMAQEFKDISLKGLESYSTRDSDGPATLLEKDGNYQLKVVKAEARHAKENEQFLALTLAVQDSDAAGALIYNNIFPEGEFESGASKGTLRAKVLIDLMTSIGMETRAAELVKTGALKLPAIAAEITGKLAHARVQQNVGNDGQLRSEPRFWIRPSKYEESKKSGVNFRVAPTTGRSARKAPGATAPNGAAAGTTSSTVSNAMLDQV